MTLRRKAIIGTLAMLALGAALHVTGNPSTALLCYVTAGLSLVAYAESKYPHV